MANFKQEMKMYDVFIDEKEISTKKLLELGFTRHDIDKLMEKGAIERIRRGYYSIKNPEGLCTYGNILHSNKYKEYERSHKAFERCLEIDPSYGTARMRIIVDDLYDGYYNSVLNNILALGREENEGYERDKNLWLYLLSFCLELPSEDFNEKVSKMSISDVLTIEGDKRYPDKLEQNKLRDMIFRQKFGLALELIKNSREYKERKINAIVTERLIEGAIAKYRDSQRQLLGLIKEEKYEEAKAYLESEKQLHGLSLANNMAVIMLDDLISIKNGVIPAVNTQERVTSYVSAICCHDYDKAQKKFNPNPKYIDDALQKYLIVKVASEKQKLVAERVEARQRQINLENIKESLGNKDVEKAIGGICSYLDRIGKGEYKAAMTQLVKLGVLKGDTNFIDVCDELDMVEASDYNLDTSVYLMDYYYAFANKDFKKASAYLELIDMSPLLGGVKIDTKEMHANLTEALENNSQKAVEKVAIDKKANMGNPSEKMSSNFDDNDQVSFKPASVNSVIQNVINNADVCMLEAMSDEEIKTVLNKCRGITNLQTMVIEEENGERRVVLRYFNKYYGGYIDMKDTLRQAGDCCKRGEYEEAISLYQSALPKLETPKSFIYANLGKCYLKAGQDGDTERAIDYLTLAMAQGEREDRPYNFDFLIENLKRETGYDGVSLKPETKAIQYKKTSNN